MELTINHEKRFFDSPPSSLENLIFSEISKDAKGIAVALNHKVIPKNLWADTKLQNTDSILIITATQGG